MGASQFIVQQFILQQFIVQQFIVQQSCLEFQIFVLFTSETQIHKILYAWSLKWSEV
jgi:hypothetical protein